MIQARVRPKTWDKATRIRARRLQRYVNWMLRDLRFGPPPEGFYGLSIGQLLEQNKRA